MVDPTTDELQAAAAAGRERLDGPRAETAHYDPVRDRVIVRLTSGIEIGFSPKDAEGLAAASAEELAVIELAPFGLGIHFPRLDVDLYVPALLQGLLGSNKWMASHLGATGGRARSAAKTAASRANGRRGGRPRTAETA